MIALALLASSSDFLALLSSRVRTASGQEFAFSFREFLKIHAQISQGRINVERCRFHVCSSDVGGAIKSDCTEVKIRFATFEYNQARVGGATHHIRSRGLTYFGNTFLSNSADYDGAGAMDTDIGFDSVDVAATNYTLNRARLWSGGLRIDSCGGTLTNCAFQSNSAKVNGAFFDFSWKPAHRMVSLCLFRNNSARARAGGVCAFHFQHSSKFEKAAFVENVCTEKPKSISIESVDSKIWLDDVYFDGKEEDELGMRFGESEFVPIDKVHFAVPKGSLDVRIIQLVNALERAIK
jgi:hypothetical protein